MIKYQRKGLYYIDWWPTLSLSSFVWIIVLSKAVLSFYPSNQVYCADQRRTWTQLVQKNNNSKSPIIRFWCLVNCLWQRMLILAHWLTYIATSYDYRAFLCRQCPRIISLVSLCPLNFHFSYEPLKVLVCNFSYSVILRYFPPFCTIEASEFGEMI